MKKAFVTGGTGFIGKYLIKELNNRGYNITCLVRKASKINGIDNLNGVNFVYGDITKPETYKDIIKDKDYVFHLAAIINSPSGEVYEKVNHYGTLKLAEICANAYKNRNKKLKRFVYISSIAASGPAVKNHLKSEDEPCNPINEYGKTKLKGEIAVKNILGEAGIPYTIIRPPNVIGAGERELEQAIKTIKSRIKPLLGNGDKQTSLIHVKDLVDAIITSAECKKTKNKIYFVTDGNEYSWRELANMIQKVLNIKLIIPLPYYVLIIISMVAWVISKITGVGTTISPSRIIDVRKNYYIYDTSKFIKDTGFKIKYSIYNGIKEAVNLLVN